MSISTHEPGALSLEFRSNPSATVRNRLAIADLRQGLSLWRLWSTLGWFDIRLRYRGSVLGPLWLTLSTAVMVAALGVLYSQLFGMDLHAYFPYLALSLVLWNYISAAVADACACFTGSDGMIRSIRMPFTMYALRAVVRNVIAGAHNVIVVVVVFWIFSAWPGVDGFAALPGMALWLVDTLAVAVLLGPVCARFRDIPPIIASVMQIAFFVSPVIWRPELVGPRARSLLVLNPFYTLLEIVRAPLLGSLPTLAIWVSALGYSVLLCAVAAALFARVRGRIAFWV